MNYKHSSIVDANGYYKTLALQFLVSAPNGKSEWGVQGYFLADGERLMDARKPDMRSHIGTNGFIKPRWNGTAWVEGATPEEITAWELEHPTPPAPTPTLEEQNRADIDYLLIMGGLANELV